MGISGDSAMGARKCWKIQVSSKLKEKKRTAHGWDRLKAAKVKPFGFIDDSPSFLAVAAVMCVLGLLQLCGERGTLLLIWENARGCHSWVRRPSGKHAARDIADEGGRREENQMRTEQTGCCRVHRSGAGCQSPTSSSIKPLTSRVMWLV